MAHAHDYCCQWKDEKRRCRTLPLGELCQNPATTSRGPSSTLQTPPTQTFSTTHLSQEPIPSGPPVQCRREGKRCSPHHPSMCCSGICESAKELRHKKGNNKPGKYRCVPEFMSPTFSQSHSTSSTITPSLSSGTEHPSSSRVPSISVSTSAASSSAPPSSLVEISSSVASSELPSSTAPSISTSAYSFTPPSSSVKISSSAPSLEHPSSSIPPTSTPAAPTSSITSASIEVPGSSASVSASPSEIPSPSPSPEAPVCIAPGGVTNPSFEDPPTAFWTPGAGWRFVYSSSLDIDMSAISALNVNDPSLARSGSRVARVPFAGRGVPTASIYQTAQTNPATVCPGGLYRLEGFARLVAPFSGPSTCTFRISGQSTGENAEVRGFDLKELNPAWTNAMVEFRMGPEDTELVVFWSVSCTNSEPTGAKLLVLVDDISLVQVIE